MLLTAFFWFPTLVALRETERYQSMHSGALNPANHELTTEWLLPLIAPNAFGTPMRGDYVPPRGGHAAVLNDYGEVSSGYAGLLTLALAFAAPFFVRSKSLWFAFALMLFSLLTISEAPLWRDALHSIPLVGISLHQRLRVLWALGVCIAATLTLDKFKHAYAPLVATVVVLADLLFTTRGYNPPAKPRDVYPVTGAIAKLQSMPRPFRIAALGWSFLPDTPSYYGIEDVKTTDPVQKHNYMRLLRGYLRIDPASPDLVIGDLSQPFADFLNIKYVYAPPGQTLDAPRFIERYRGPDGAVYENRNALPRYFFVKKYRVEGDFERALWFSRDIRDYRNDAIVDHVPSRMPPDALSGVGDVRIARYASRETELDIVSRGWNLLVSSDTHWRGWRAYWNGKRWPVVTVNGAFLGCFVPPGEGRLRFRFMPDEFVNASRVSIASLLLFVVAMLVWRRTPGAREWNELAHREPYYAVLTDERFLRDRMNDDARREFFATGEADVERLLEATSARKSALDFGCGVGRLTMALAKHFEHVAGVDVSPEMLRIARENAPHITFTDAIPDERFDFICSLIVFQHIPVRRGEEIYAELLDRLAPRGVAAIEFSLKRPGSALRRFARAARARMNWIHRFAQIVERNSTKLPYMQMNEYDLDAIRASIASARCEVLRLIPTNHGGIEGAIVIARKIA
jgi:SAM-dependent methyltransferase